MLGEKELDEAVADLALFKVTASHHHDTLSKVLDRYETLVTDYQRLKSDYEEERDARERYKQMAKGQERDPFVLVLIDGDGYVFDDDLVSTGAEGGQKAAQLLESAVMESVRKNGLGPCRIMVHVFANTAGLSKALARAGLSGNHSRSIAPFCAGFVAARGLNFFTDAGDLKEGADFKIRELFHLYADNTSQCKHIFFAGCHDVGYVSLLMPLSGQRNRLTLLKGANFHPQFHTLNLHTEEVRNLFRTTLLDGYNTIRQPSFNNVAPRVAEGLKNYVIPDNNKSINGIGVSTQTICTHFKEGKCRYGKNCMKTHILPNGLPDQASISGETENVAPRPLCSHFLRGNCRYGKSCNWLHPEGVLPVRNGMAPQPTTATESQQQKAQGLLPKPDHDSMEVPLNAQGQRLDYCLEPATETEWKAWKARASQRKVCNNNQLGLECPNGGVTNCEYDHEQLPPELMKMLRHVVANIPCSRKSACRKQGCPNGHVCQKKECGGGQRYSAICRLGNQAHNVDMQVAKWVTAEPRKSAVEAEASVIETQDQSEWEPRPSAAEVEASWAQTDDQNEWEPRPSAAEVEASWAQTDDQNEWEPRQSAVEVEASKAKTDDPNDWEDDDSDEGASLASLD